jgi:hypothetical protein
MTAASSQASPPDLAAKIAKRRANGREEPPKSWLATAGPKKLGVQTKRCKVPQDRLQRRGRFFVVEPQRLGPCNLSY